MEKNKTISETRKILDEFSNEEIVHTKRKGAFKIDVPFDEAMKKILKAKPKSKSRKRG